MHDHESLRRSGQRDIQGAQALVLLVDDPARLDDHDAVELESLHEPDRNNGDLCVERLARRAPHCEAA